ncbi:MAG: hypothetical protein JWO03_2658 [Bacteroidetes bacterium]|nr:hypothetical protein [Bacteroidota bacterium]
MAKRKKKTGTELTTENELLKLKMMAEFGGDFAGSENLPPEVEHAFLKQINRFHQLHDKAGLISIYNFVGEPLYNHVHDLSDKEVPKELKKLLKLLAKKGIVVDTLSGVPDREMYRFVTEEIFKQEIQNIRMPNWTIHLIYEEFHPSDEFDVKNQAGHALAFIFDKAFVTADFIFTEEMKSDIGLSIDKEELIEKIDTFKLGYNQMQFTGAEFKSIDIDTESKTAHVIVVAEYRAQTQKGRRFKSETSEVHLGLVRDPDTQFWMVSQLSSDKL